MIYLYVTLVDKLAFGFMETLVLCRLHRKILKYEHHNENYKISTEKNIIPYGLQLQKTPLISHVSGDFEEKWNDILREAEKGLVELLLLESRKKVEILKLELYREAKRLFPEAHVNKIENLKRQNAQLSDMLSRRRQHKWQKFERNPTVGKSKYADVTISNTTICSEEGRSLAPEVLTKSGPLIKPFFDRNGRNASAQGIKSRTYLRKSLPGRNPKNTRNHDNSRFSLPATRTNFNLIPKIDKSEHVVATSKNTSPEESRSLVPEVLTKSGSSENPFFDGNEGNTSIQGSKAQSCSRKSLPIRTPKNLRNTDNSRFSLPECRTEVKQLEELSNVCGINSCDVNPSGVNSCDVNSCDVNSCDVNLCDVNSNHTTNSYNFINSDAPNAGSLNRAAIENITFRTSKKTSATINSSISVSQTPSVEIDENKTAQIKKSSIRPSNKIEICDTDIISNVRSFSIGTTENMKNTVDIGGPSNLGRVHETLTKKSGEAEKVETIEKSQSSNPKTPYIMDTLLPSAISGDIAESSEDNNSNDSTLDNSDLHLANILASLQEGDSFSFENRPPVENTNTTNPDNSSLSNEEESNPEGENIQTDGETGNGDSVPYNGRLQGYFCSEVVFNLSNKVLSETEIRVLGKGLGFVPTPVEINETDLKRDFEEFSRRMRLKWHFRNEPSDEFSETPAFRPKSTWKPPTAHVAIETFLSIIEHELFSLLPGTPENFNLTTEEWKAMKTLAYDRSIIIKRADKGSCVVVWDREDYLAEAENQLNNQNVYVEADSFSDEDLSGLAEKSNNLFKKLFSRNFITKKELAYFLFEHRKTCNLGKMYLLPKIHKRTRNVPGRPVISNCGTPTEKVSEFLDFHLKPVMREGKSYVKDTGDFLEKLKHLGKIPENSILVTADVVGLYPSIPHGDGLEYLRSKLEERTDKTIPSEDLVNMAEFVLKNNYFEFNSQIKKQISGTAMGTKFAPAYACIFMDRVETDFLTSERIQPWVWLRYIDDIFFIWTEGEEKLAGFLERLNTFHPNLKYTHSFEKNEKNNPISKVDFLDVTISVEGDYLKTNLYSKPTDCHQFLDYESSHPTHVKKSIIFSQGLRIKRLCSDQVDFENNLREMEKWFENRGYPKRVIKLETEKVRKKNISPSAENIVRPKKNGVPLVITFHPKLENFNSVIKKHLAILYRDPTVKALFTSSPFVSYRAGYSLTSHLVRAKVYPLERIVGSQKCNKPRCQTCKNVNETTTFQCSKDKKVYKINYQFNCDSKCLVYLLTCKQCLIQYVGVTIGKFRFRWNNYKSCHRKIVMGEDAPQVQLHKHFLCPGHNGLMGDCEITFIDKTRPSDPTQREDFWRRKLKTLHPNGLNVEENI